MLVPFRMLGLFLCAGLMAVSVGALSPSDAMKLDQQANICMVRKNYDEALEKYRMALEADPEYAQAHAHIAACYEAIGLYELAAEHWTKVQELGGTSAGEVAGKLRALEGKSNIIVPVEDKESDLWRYRWKHKQGKVYEWFEDFSNRQGILKTHPLSAQEPSILAGKLVVPARTRSAGIEMQLKAANDCVMEVYANGERLARDVIDNRGWAQLNYDLPRTVMTGRPVDVEIHHLAGGKEMWSFEGLFFDYINVTVR